MQYAAQEACQHRLKRAFEKSSTKIVFKTAKKSLVFLRLGATLYLCKQAPSSTTTSTPKSKATSLPRNTRLGSTCKKYIIGAKSTPVETVFLTNTNPLQGFVSVCCGAEHDINAEYHMLNESIVGGCSACGHYSEFDIFENFVENRLDLETFNH